MGYNASCPYQYHDSSFISLRFVDCFAVRHVLSFDSGRKFLAFYSISFPECIWICPGSSYWIVARVGSHPHWFDQFGAVFDWEHPDSALRRLVNPYRSGRTKQGIICACRILKMSLAKACPEGGARRISPRKVFSRKNLM